MVQTVNPSQEYAAKIQEEKLNNYAKYQWPGLDKDINEMVTSRVVPDFVIHHANTSIAKMDTVFIITTMLCCEDKEGEANEY